MELLRWKQCVHVGVGAARRGGATTCQHVHAEPVPAPGDLAADTSQPDHAQRAPGHLLAVGGFPEVTALGGVDLRQALPDLQEAGDYELGDRDAVHAGGRGEADSPFSQAGGEKLAHSRAEALHPAEVRGHGRHVEGEVQGQRDGDPAEGIPLRGSEGRGEVAQVGTRGRPPPGTKLGALDVGNLEDLDRGVDGTQRGQVVIQILARARLVFRGVHDGDDDRAVRRDRLCRSAWGRCAHDVTSPVLTSPVLTAPAAGCAPPTAPGREDPAGRPGGGARRSRRGRERADPSIPR